MTHAMLYENTIFYEQERYHHINQMPGMISDVTHGFICKIYMLYLTHPLRSSNKHISSRLVEEYTISPISDITVKSLI